MGLEDRVGEVLQGGVRFHLADLGFLVALALVPGGPGSVDSSDHASFYCAAAACSKIGAALSSDTRAKAAHHPLSDSLRCCRPDPAQETTHLTTIPIHRLIFRRRMQLGEDIASWEFPLLLCKRY